jgi:serine protease Do
MPTNRRSLVSTALIALVVAAVVVVIALSGCGGARRGAFYVQGPPNAPERDISQAVTKVAPAVVRVDTVIGGARGVLGGLFGSPRGPSERGEASGVIIEGRRGYVLTNAHVTRNARTLRVTLPDGRQFKGEVVGADAVTDIAILRIRGRNLPEAMLGSSQRLPVGSWVVAVGNPYGLDNTVTAGVLSAKGRTIGGEGNVPVTDLLQTDAPINAGNSGGALIDLRGQVVGMPTAIIPFAKGIGFAVAIDTVKDVMPQLVRTGKVAHAWLGISVGASRPGGPVVIQRVLPGTPAAKAGLRAGDVIVSIGREAITEPQDVARLLRQAHPGQRITLTITRQGKRKAVAVRLAEMPSMK